MIGKIKIAMRDMNIYEIFQKHNRPWTEREVIIVSLFFAGACLILLVLWYQNKLQIIQVISILIAICYLTIVFASTVFTRQPGIRRYKWMPFWSWKRVFLYHDRELLQENFLNCILLFPLGMLLPFIRNHPVKASQAFGVGFVFSAFIEVSQLIFRRGLFEWDDMLHNSVGCMVGCVAINAVIKILRRHIW